MVHVGGAGDGVGLGIGFDLRTGLQLHRWLELRAGLGLVWLRIIFGTVVVDVLTAFLRAAVHFHPVGLVHGARRHAGGCDAGGCQERPG